MPRGPRRWAWPAAFAATAVLLTAAAAWLFGQYLAVEDADHGKHLLFTRQLVLEGRLLPHFGYHVMLALAAGWSADPGRLRSAARVVLVLLVLAKLAVSLGFTRELLRSTGAALRPGPAIGLAVALFLIAPLPRWGRLEHVYLGQLSPTVWHNPTAIAALPFAVASFWLFLRAWPTPGGSRWLAPAGRRTAGLLLAGVLLAATTAIKPNFALAFAPVVVLLLLPSLDLFGMLAVLAPASCLLVWQYIHALSSGLANDGLTTLQPLEVWSIYSPQPLVSALVSLAFPLAVLAGSRRAVLVRPLLAAWLITLVAVLHFALLAEPEPRLGDANYYWGVVPAVYLLFLVSAVELLARPAGSRAAYWWRAGCWLLLALHAASGIVLLARPFQLVVFD